MKKRYIIGGVILVAAVGYLLYMALGSSTIYYVTVSELLDGGSNTYDTNIRVAGKVADGSIAWNAEELELGFAVVEGGASLPVIYEGTRPSSFKAGADVVVEGQYHPDRIFRATSVLLKCPSKYLPEE